MMKKVPVKIWIFILVLFAGLGALAQETDDRVLITIDDEKITVNEFLNVYQKNNVDTDLSDKKSMEDYLELYINFRLKVKEARDLGMDTAKAFVEELDGYRQQLAEPYFNDQEVTDELLQEAYDRLMYDIRASHILIKLDENALPEDTALAYEKIMKIRERIMKGEDFVEVAAEVSDDPSARDREVQGQMRRGNGGDLGYFTVFDMVYPFETGAYTTPVGEVSMPVRTSFGYHIIKVTDKLPAMGQATVAHLYIAMPKNAMHADSVRKEEEIWDYYNYMMDGEAFEKMVAQYSDDRGSKDKGGLLPPFGSNRMVPDFIKAISEIKDTGDIHEPMMTSFGWHIIKLIERDRPGDYAEEAPELKNRMARDMRSNKSRESVINRIQEENGFTEYPDNLKSLLQAIDSTYYSRDWSADKVKNMKKKIFVLGGKKYTQHDFAEHMDMRQTRRGTKSLDLFFYEQYGEYVDEACINLEDKLLEEKYPEFKILMQEYRDGILLFNLTDQKVWSKAVKDTLGLQEFYEANKHNYKWEKRLDADIIMLNDPSQESAVKSMIDNAGDKSLQEIGLDTIPGIFVKSGLYPKGENGFIDRIEWKKGYSETLPLHDFHELYDGKANDENSVVFARINNIRKPEPKTLDEARGLVTSDYQNYLEKNWIKELKDKYTVTVNEEVLDNIE